MRALVAPYRWRTAVIRPAIAGGAFWLLAILVIVAVYFPPRHLISAQTAVTGLVGFCLLAIAARWPDRSLLALIIVLPFSGFILAKLWAFGVPTSIVRHLSAWKETLALGVILAGARNFIATGRRADAVDRLALGLVGIIALYILGQKVLAPSDHASMTVRLYAFRAEAGFALLLLGARHAPLPANFLDRAARAALAVAIVVAGVSVFEALDSAAWNRFVVNTIQYTHYQIGVLHGSPPNPYDIRLWGDVGGTRIIRTGSVFDSALTCGFYLVLGFALALERLARGRGGRWALLALLLIAAGLLLTQTRSAILAALIVGWFAFRPAAGRRRHWRTQLAFVAAALAIVAVPAAISTGLSKRITAPTSNTDNAGHISAFWSGVHSIEHHPFGTGLATSAGVGQTYQQTSGLVVPENNYLQVGVELGVVGGLVFVALTVALVLSLRRGARRRPNPAIAAAAGSMAGLAVAAWFLEPWFDFSVAWTIWGFAGAALGAGRVRVAQRQQAAAPPARNAPQPLPA
jgi:hypothetical protein